MMHPPVRMWVRTVCVHRRIWNRSEFFSQAQFRNHAGKRTWKVRWSAGMRACESWELPRPRHRAAGAGLCPPAEAAFMLLLTRA